MNELYLTNWKHHMPWPRLLLSWGPALKVICWKIFKGSVLFFRCFCEDSKPSIANQMEYAKAALISRTWTTFIIKDISQDRQQSAVSSAQKSPSGSRSAGTHLTESPSSSIPGVKLKDFFNFSLSIFVLIRRREQNGCFILLKGVKTRGKVKKK